MAPGDREPKGRSMDDRSKTDRLCADGRKIGFVPMDAATSIGVRVRDRTKIEVLTEDHNVKAIRRSIRLRRMNAEGLKEGIGCCMPMDDRYDGIEVNVGSFRWNRIGLTKEGIRESVPDRRVNEESVAGTTGRSKKNSGMCCR